MPRQVNTLLNPQDDAYTLNEAIELLENKIAFIKEVHGLGFTLVVDSKCYEVKVDWRRE